MTQTNIQQPLILAVDTTSARASMAISAGDKIIAELAVVGNERRSTNLLNEIDWLLARVGLTIGDISAFCTLVGPGSFTGLRVGLATIKGFAHALNKPVIAMKTAEVFARSCGENACTCVLLDAHRGEAFFQLFSIDEENQAELSELTIAKIDQVLPLVYQYQQSEGLSKIVFAGDVLELYEQEFFKFAGENSLALHKAKLLTTNRLGWILNKPTTFLAPIAALYAQEKFATGEVLTASEISAYYVRPAEAEIKLQLGLIGKKKTNLS